MCECKFCHKDVDLRTDDHFNIEHTQFKCPHCGEWQPVETES